MAEQKVLSMYNNGKVESFSNNGLQERNGGLSISKATIDINEINEVDFSGTIRILSDGTLVCEEFIENIQP